MEEILDKLDEIIIVTDNAGEIMFINEKGCFVLGIDQNQPFSLKINHLLLEQYNQTEIILEKKDERKSYSLRQYTLSNGNRLFVLQDKSLDRFALSFSDALCSPLTSIKNSLALLVEGHNCLLLEETKQEVLNIAQQETDKVIKLVDNFGSMLKKEVY